MSNENIQTIVTYYPCRLLLKVWMSKEGRISHDKNKGLFRRKDLYFIAGKQGFFNVPDSIG